MVFAGMQASFAYELVSRIKEHKDYHSHMRKCIKTPFIRGKKAASGNCVVFMQRRMGTNFHENTPFLN